MTHKAALFASFALAIVTAALIATQWGTLISRGSPSDTAIGAGSPPGTSSASIPVDPTQSTDGQIAEPGMSLDVPVSTATDPAATATDEPMTYAGDDEDDGDDSAQSDDDDGDEHEEDDDEYESDDD